MQDIKNTIVGFIRTMAVGVAAWLLTWFTQWEVPMPEGFAAYAESTAFMILMGLFYLAINLGSKIKGMGWLQFFLIWPTAPTYIRKDDQKHVQALVKKLDEGSRPTLR